MASKSSQSITPVSWLLGTFPWGRQLYWCTISNSSCLLLPLKVLQPPGPSIHAHSGPQCGTFEITIQWSHCINTTLTSQHTFPLRILWFWENFYSNPSDSYSTSFLPSLKSNGITFQQMYHTLNSPAHLPFIASWKNPLWLPMFIFSELPLSMSILA